MNNNPKNENRGRPPMPGRPGPGGPMAGRINGEKPKNVGKTLKRLISYIGKSRTLLILMLFITLCLVFFELIGPSLQGAAIDTIEYDEERGLAVHFYEEQYAFKEGTTKGLYFYVSFMALIFVLNAAVSYLQGRISARLSQNTVYNMRKELFKKISKLPIKYTDTHKHGDIMSRMTNDVDNVSNAVAQSISSLFSGVLTFVGAIAMMLYYNWIMMLISLLTIPLTIFISTTLAKFMKKYFAKRQQLLGALNGHSEEMIVGYKTVMAYGKEKSSSEEFKKISADLKTYGIKANVWGGVMGPCMNIIGNLQYLLLATFGGILFLRGSVSSIGTIQTILGYSKKVTRPINEIANQYAQILTALAGAERIFQIMDTPDEIDEGKSEFKVSDINGYIDFDNIDFSYVEGERVLNGFCLNVKPGQKIALVGATGSGKTTVVNLLTRFYDVDSGEIRIDGKNINDIPKETLRKSIAIVLQDTVLFSDSIRDNIKYGRLDASEEEIKAAAKFANAHTFIERLHDGYDTVLSESGGNLSQGQRQLLSISRAVLADPRILILDEATSSVDTRTEKNIQDAMVSLMKDRTSIIIAHRLSTIRDADVIAVIKEGRVFESGTHEELLERKGEYYKLYSNQFAGLET